MKYKALYLHLFSIEYKLLFYVLFAFFGAYSILKSSNSSAEAEEIPTLTFNVILITNYALYNCKDEYVHKIKYQRKHHLCQEYDMFMENVSQKVHFRTL